MGSFSYQLDYSVWVDMHIHTIGKSQVEMLYIVWHSKNGNKYLQETAKQKGWQVSLINSVFEYKLAGNIINPLNQGYPPSGSSLGSPCSPSGIHPGAFLCWV